MRVLFIAHEMNLGGATRSMLNLVDALKGRVEYIVVVREEKGPLVDELKKRQIAYIVVASKPWLVRKPEGAVQMVARKCSECGADAELHSSATSNATTNADSTDSSQNRFSLFADSLHWLYTRAKYYALAHWVNVASARKLKGFICEKEIDLIHTNSSTVEVGAILHRMTGIPHVWHIREFGAEDHGMYPRCSEKHFYRTIDHESTRVIVVSQALAQKYRLRLTEHPPVVVYNGVGRENIIAPQDKTPMEGRPIHLLISGALHPGKGQQYALEAVRRLVAAGEDDFRLYIAGRGDEEWLRSLDGFEDEHVVFLGLVSDMPALRRDMDIELVCSRSEAFGRVTVEAMMACMPVIGTDTGGTPELITDGVTGFMYHAGDVADLTEKITYFLHHKEVIRDMGITAQSYAVSRYTIDTCAKNIYSNYKSALNPNGGGDL